MLLYYHQDDPNTYTNINILDKKRKNNIKIYENSFFQDPHLNPPSNSRNDLLFQDTNLNKTSREIINNNSINFPNDKFSDVENSAAQSIQELEEIPKNSENSHLITEIENSGPLKNQENIETHRKKWFNWLHEQGGLRNKQAFKKTCQSLDLKESTATIYYNGLFQKHYNKTIQNQQFPLEKQELIEH